MMMGSIDIPEVFSYSGIHGKICGREQMNYFCRRLLIQIE